MTGRPAIALVGAGRMGLALAKGWLASPSPPDLRLHDPFPSDAARALADGRACALNPERPPPADILVLAVKPQAFDAAAPDAKALLKPGGLVVSVMAGTPIARIAAATGAARIVRTMPNTPGAIGRGVTAFALSDAADLAGDAEAARGLLAPLGAVEGPLPEDLIDAVTALSGSGPAYVFLLTEAMADAGARLGLPEDVAARLARRTVIGAGALMEADAAPPDALRKAVTSPGGTTEAALGVLMREGGVPTLMVEALEAALKRARELAG